MIVSAYCNLYVLHVTEIDIKTKEQKLLKFGFKGYKPTKTKKEKLLNYLKSKDNTKYFIIEDYYRVTKVEIDTNNLKVDNVQWIQNAEDF